MAKCRIKRGFFLLRDCGLDATRQCRTCERRACNEHGVATGAAWTCTDCHARQLESEPEARDLAWASRLRDQYYSSTGYSPIYIAHQYDSYYDGYDVRAFDADLLETPEVDFDADGGFFDS